MYYTALLQKYPLISDQVSHDEMAVILRELENILQRGIEGAIVELGCYAGTTSLFIQRLFEVTGQQREFHVYDSFEGLPPKAPQDVNAAGIDFVAGELAVSKKEFIQNFKRAKLKLPIIHKRWFNELTAVDIPQPIAFAFLDGDFYESITDSLRLVWPHLSKDAKVLVHDYNRETLPGAAKAVRDFLQNKQATVTVEKNIAIISQ